MARISRVLMALAAVIAVTAAYASLAQAGGRPAGDIAFIVDGSSSMRTEINSVRERVDEIVAALENEVDARYALVAFGGSVDGSSDGLPRAITPLTDAQTFTRALDDFETAPAGSGSYEPGLEAVRFAMSDLSGYRAGATSCVILFSDEAPAFVEDQNTDLDRALEALDARDAVFFGVIEPGDPLTRDTYGPAAGSLATTTGGQIFDIDDFAQDPSAVLDAMLKACRQEAAVRASAAAFTAVPTSGVAPLEVSFSATTDPETTRLHWDFGDGSSSAQKNVRHVFKRAGTYNVLLSAEGPSGTASVAVQIHVRARGPRIIKLSDCTITGTAGNDVLVGTRHADALCGLGGDDVLIGRGGNDALAGGPGQDRLVGGPGRHWLAGQFGDDVLLGGRGADILLGAKGRDKLTGGPGDDRLRGGFGADRLVGNGGRDILYGGFGWDVLIGSRGRDRLYAGAGDDKLFAIDRTKDLVDGGPGRDSGRVDPFDDTRRLLFIFT